jgi:hypothetical protein
MLSTHALPTVDDYLITPITTTLGSRQSMIPTLRSTSSSILMSTFPKFFALHLQLLTLCTHVYIYVIDVINASRTLWARTNHLGWGGVTHGGFSSEEHVGPCPMDWWINSGNFMSFIALPTLLCKGYCTITWGGVFMHLPKKISRPICENKATLTYFLAPCICFFFLHDWC